MQWLTNFNTAINGFVWDNGLYLLLFTGLLTTVITGVFQVTHLGHWFKETIGKIFQKDVSGHVKGKSISQFQALCTALAATIGVGNIAGVAAAIVNGGPGAVFSAIFAHAFSAPAVWGGVTGITVKAIITQGCKRDVFSNEAGLGSSVMIQRRGSICSAQSL